MVQFRLFLCMIYVAMLRTSECSSNKLGLSPRSQSITKQLPLGPHLPSDTVYVPYLGSTQNLLMSAQHYNTNSSSFSDCKTMAPENGAHFWGFWNSTCMLGTLAAPVCYVMHGDQTEFFILESFLTEGSPDDDPFPSTAGRNRFMYGESNVAFRVKFPTISKFPEFTTKQAFEDPMMWYRKKDLVGKTFVFHKYGGIVTTGDRVLVDPICYTNSSCGVPFLTVSTHTITTPHVVLEQVCGQTIDLNDNSPALYVFSHAGIGCKMFPAVYPTPDCALTINSASSVNTRVELVNFKKETCGGYELKFILFKCDEETRVIDVCEKYAPTHFSSSGGKLQVKLAGSAPMDWQRYGFIISVRKFGENIESPQCSSGTPVPSATDFPQVSTAGPTQTFTDSPTQSPTEGSTQNPTEGSTQSPTEGSTQSPTEGSTQNPTEGSTQSPTEGSTQSPTDSPTQGPTIGSTQYPTDSPTQSPTDSPTQSPTNGLTHSPTDGLPESPTDEYVQSNTNLISDDSNNFESGSTSVSPQRSTKSHHLHFLMKLGIELKGI